jgi:hypothetical protein
LGKKERLDGVRGQKRTIEDEASRTEKQVEEGRHRGWIGQKRTSPHSVVLEEQAPDVGPDEGAKQETDRTHVDKAFDPGDHHRSSCIPV